MPRRAGLVISMMIEQKSTCPDIPETHNSMNLNSLHQDSSIEQDPEELLSEKLEITCLVWTEI